MHLADKAESERLKHSLYFRCERRFWLFWHTWFKFDRKLPVLFTWRSVRNETVRYSTVRLNKQRRPRSVCLFHSERLVQQYSRAIMQKARTGAIDSSCRVCHLWNTLATAKFVRKTAIFDHKYLPSTDGSLEGYRLLIQMYNKAAGPEVHRVIFTDTHKESPYVYHSFYDFGSWNFGQSYNKFFQRFPNVRDVAVVNIAIAIPIIIEMLYKVCQRLSLKNIWFGHPPHGHRNLGVVTIHQGTIYRKDPVYKQLDAVLHAFCGEVDEEFQE